jgi:hypothetical protein
LSTARAHLQRELGEGDLAYLNEPGVLMRRWAWLPLDQMSVLEARLAMRNEERAMRNEEKRAGKGEGTMSDSTSAGMSRRKLLETAGTAAAGAAAAGLAGPGAAATTPQDPADVVDDRLTRKVTLSLKATALADLCARLQADTGIHVAANPSVADEKVTLFCEKLPLREVMRQLSRPFGYTWLRTGSVFGVRYSVLGGPTPDPNTEHRTPNTEYRYELTQDLRGQLLEEELQNRDRHEALLSLEREVEKYRPYLDLSPDEAQARAQTAPPEEKQRLETLAGKGWGVIQMYFRLSPGDLAALRAGETVTFSADPKPGEQPLPPDVARGVLQTWRDWRVAKRGDRFEYDSAENVPDGLPPSAVPEVQAKVRLKLDQSELGQFTLNEGASGFTIGNSNSLISGFSIAVGTSPAVRSPENEVANARLARDPALRPEVTFKPQTSCRSDLSPSPSPARGGGPAVPGPERSNAEERTEPKVTSGDVLEALHRATGLPVVADFYTHLYSPGAVSTQNQPLFHALSQFADTMHMRWRKEDEWLQFRSAGHYNDRLKEVPNRLLSRWSAARVAHGSLTLDDLVEIVQLADPQLDADDMAEGARECWGLTEWDLARHKGLRPHLRSLASFTPAQRQEAMSPAGLAFTKMTLAQQQQFISHVDLRGSELHSLADLGEATMHVDYTLPGWFQWHAPADLLGPGWPPLRPALVRERTREAALQAARRIHPQATDAQVTPTEAELAFIYTWGDAKAREIRWVRPNGNWGRQVNSG